MKKLGNTERYTLAEAAKFMGMSPITLRVQLHRKRLKGEKHGRDWFLSGTEIRSYAGKIRRDK